MQRVRDMGGEITNILTKELKSVGWVVASRYRNETV